ncbi:MAG: leucine-rich repeat protein, partial [Acutalibacteraceae bacterium]
LIQYPVGNERTDYIIPNSVTIICDRAFYDCNGITNVTILDSVTSIGAYAFYNTRLWNDSSNWENNVLYIGNHLIKANNELSGSYSIKDGTKTISDNAFEFCSYLTNLTIPGSVTSIGNNVFYNCTGLTSVIIGNGVTSIGNSAFSYCIKLSSVSIPSSVSSIGDYAFYNCDGLTSITIGDGVTNIGDYAFYNCDGLTSITIGDSVTSIGDYAFYNCDGLTSITIGDGVTSIGDYAFYNCTSLKIISIGNSVSTIGDYAFKYCSNLERINLPDNVTIGSSALYGCDSLATIDAGKNIKGIKESGISDTAFFDNKDNWENGVLYLGSVLLKAEPSFKGVYTVKDGTTEILGDAFSSCSGLTSVILPASLEAIGNNAFQFCSKLKTVNIPEGVKSIGDYAFAGCFALTDAVLPSSLEELGEGVFMLDIALKSANVPNSITEIPSLLFAGCLSLENAPINANTVYIGEGAFVGCTSFKDIFIPASVKAIGLFTFAGCTSLSKFTVDPANKIISTDSYGALFGEIDDMTVLLSYPSANPATSYSIPESTTAMGIPFVSCKNLESINIPAGFCADETSDSYDSNLLAVLITTFTMKVDVNSLIAKIKSYGEDGINSLIDFYILMQQSDNESEIKEKLASFIDSALDYINGIAGVDDAIGKVENIVTDIMDAATLDNFKSFTVTDGNPHLFAKDGVLYYNGIDPDSGKNIKALLSCPAGKTDTVKIEKGVNCIIPAAFALCKPDEIVLPDSLTEILPATFALCKANKLVIPSTVEKMDNFAMTVSMISSIEIEKDSTVFEQYEEGKPIFVACFADEIILPDSLEEIPDSYFIGCMAKSYHLPENLKTIGKMSFMANILLDGIEIPDDVETIKEMAFTGSIKLSEIDISRNSKLKSIDQFAFSLSSISGIYIPAGVEYIGNFALNPSLGGTADCLLTMLAPSIDEYINSLKESGINLDGEKIKSTISHVASWFTKNSGVTVDKRNPFFSSVNGDLYSYDKSDLVKVAETASGIYEVPSSVINISAGAFAFTGVNKIIVPDNVVTAEAGAFAFAPVTEIELGAGIKEINDSAFGGCTLLKRVTILPSVVSIDEEAFAGCSDDLTIVGYANSYAHRFAIDHEIKFETIDGKAYVSLKAPSEIASPIIPVYGNANANTVVSIYDGDVKIGEVNSGANGYWRTTAELINPADNSVHTLVAKVFEGTDKDAVSEPVNVLFSTSVPAFESITCYHGSQSRTITKDTIGIVPESISFSSSRRFTYEIKLSAYDGSKTVYVVSNGMKLPAVYDVRTNTYIATGYFDESNHSYVPEYVTIELGGCTLANTSFRFPFIIDPSGFVYEAVHSNRVEGATATIFFQDQNGLAQLWADAPIFGQEATITTGADGIFEWVVPNGLWQVKVEKEGYETAFSEWLPVPPEQLEVYIGIVSKLAPTVKYVNGYTDGIDVTFNQYMDISTINSSNIVITDSKGKAVSGSWSAVDKEQSGKDSSVYYATTFRFTSDFALSGEYTVSISGVKNYADKEIEVPYSQTVTAKERVETLNVPESLNLVYGKEYTDSDENKITIDGGVPAAGMKVNVTLSDDFYVESVSTVTLDDAGKAILSVNPLKPGTSTISFNLDGTNLVEKTEIVVSMPEEIKVTGITISDNNVELQTGAEKQLYANVAPDFATIKDVKWSSSDDSVVSIDESGRIKGIKAGKATITVTTSDGGFTASCNVTVVEQTYTVTWIVDGETQIQKYTVGSAIKAPTVSEKEGYEFKGWTPSVPATMPEYDLTFTAVFEKIETPSENEITASIKSPSTTTINYGDAIILHAEFDGTLPEGARIEWTSDNGNFDMSVSEDGLTCKISPKSSGKTVFTATVYDKDGNIISSDTQEMNAKAGLWQKIVAFFKKIFGLTKTIPEAFKGIF